MQSCAESLFLSRNTLEKKRFVAKIGFDTAESGPSKTWATQPGAVKNSHFYRNIVYPGTWYSVPQKASLCTQIKFRVVLPQTFFRAPQTHILCSQEKYVPNHMFVYPEKRFVYPGGKKCTWVGTQ